MNTETQEAVIERVRREVVRRKGCTETPPLPAPQKKSMLQRAAADLDRALSKHLKARKWPRLFRSLRRNQDSINEALITAMQALVRETEYFSRLAPPLAIQQSNLITRVQRDAEQLRTLSGQVKELDTALAASGQLSPSLPKEREERFLAAAESEFRGGPQLVRERLLEFQPLLGKLRGRIPRGAALDLACGRGEWLQILKENGFEPRGVDRNGQMVNGCREAGFAAVQGDALEFLRGLPADSLAAVTGFHLAEHLEPDRLFAVILESYRVTLPGGLVIFETANPECTRVATHTFYLDPGSRRPIPMELLSFMASHAGFSDVRTQRLHPWKDEAGRVNYTDYAGIFIK